MKEHSNTTVTGIRSVCNPLGAVAFTLASVLLIGVAAACSGGGSSTPTSTISSFKATAGTSSGSSISITSGTSVTLSWTVTNATTVTLNGNTVTGTSVTVSPTQTTTFTLTATNSKGQSTSQSVTVNVASAAAISSFTVTYNGTPDPAATAITSGYSRESATLTWVVNSATTSVKLNGTTVTGTSATVSPTQTTTYTLTAVNAPGDSVTKTATVTVEAAPSIGPFTTSPTSLAYGSSFIFVATESCSKSATVSPLPGNNSLYSLLGYTSIDGPKQIFPSATTTYTATCTNNAGDSTTAQTTVYVRPGVSSFYSDAATINLNGSGTTLRWNVGDATSVDLYSYPTASGSSAATVLAGVTNDTSYVVNPTVDTSYYLLATNADGNTQSATIGVSVSSSLSDVTSFLAYSSAAVTAKASGSTAAGTPVFLNPVFASTDTATITDDAGNTVAASVASGDFVSVSPTQTTTYTLTATNTSSTTPLCTADAPCTEVRKLRIIVGEIKIFSGIASIASSNPTVGTTWADTSANTAQFGLPYGLTTDASGNVYLADRLRCNIFALDKTTGYVTRIAGQALAGTSDSGTSTDGDALTVAKLTTGTPGGLSVDSTGNLYFFDYQNIRTLSAGMVTSLAGYYGATNDKDGVGTDFTTGAGFSNTYKINSTALDSLGELIIGEGRTLRVMDSTGKVTTLAGSTGTRALTNGTGKTGNGSGTAMFYSVAGITIDKSTDTIYISDSRTIRKMVPDKSTATSECPGAACWTWTLTTWINPSNTTGFQDGSAISARSAGFGAIARDSDGTLYVYEGAGYLRRITSDGVVDTIAGNATTASSCYSTTMCTLPNATNPSANPLPGVMYYGPSQIAIDPVSKRLFFTVADTTAIYTMPR